MPEIGKQYDWHAPDVDVIRVTVVGHPPIPVDPSHAGDLAELCRVQFECSSAWARISELREIAD